MTTTGSLSTSASPIRAGRFQTHEFSQDGDDAPAIVTIRDELYGTHTITEPVLTELLRSAALARLAGVHQHGISGLLGLTPKVTRLEHTVGAMLLVRHVGAGVAEQVAALLHDVSHTAMSHVVDFAMASGPEDDEGSFHEVHKMRYIRDFTPIPAILARHGFVDRPGPLDEELFPLVEQPAPRLCADRLDYALRDVVGLQHMALADARRVIASLKAWPSVDDDGRYLVLQDQELALALARAYAACDRDVWGNPSHGDLYTRTAGLMKSLIHQGAVQEAELWTLSDEEFWARMRGAANPEQQAAMDRLESEGLPDGKSLALPRLAKVRTIDPDVCLPKSEKPVPLSELWPAYDAERQEYIKARQSLYAPPAA
ncbi:phosphoribosylamidoimidazole-succinocarboxamidesynthase [Apiospora phragmitis]|uniref:Phosphoribosylamidoimidazole-succinocarboxamidesynthase n=1 Tax=Apiospora phragmitis TaxID=2905665 RepID=A0ABR1TRY7_9PEZI